MRFCKKLITLIVALLLLTTTLPAALAVQDTSVEAGKTAVLTFSFEDIYNVDGTFTVTDSQGIVAGYTVSVINAGTTSVTVNGNRLWAQPGAEAVKTSLSVAVKVTLSKGAVAGASCTVSFDGIYGDANEKPGNEHEVHQAAVVTVKTPEVVVTPTPTPTILREGLEKQLAVANGLNAVDYTTESWEPLNTAVQNGQAALKGTDQKAIDEAERAVEAALSALVKMDYAGLRKALAAADAMVESEELAALLERLTDAVTMGDALLTSSDQKAVDTAAAEINDVLASIDEQMEALQISEPVEIRVEVPVEVLPEDDFCNIPQHRLWPILLFCSLAVNVVLVVVIVMYLIKKKKYQNDNTPLVDYDIEDDI